MSASSKRFFPAVCAGATSKPVFIHMTPVAATKIESAVAKHAKSRGFQFISPIVPFTARRRKCTVLATAAFAPSTLLGRVRDGDEHTNALPHLSRVHLFHDWHGDLRMIKTFKYRLKDRRAAKQLSAHAVACNQVWNYCNAVQKDIERRYRAGERKRRWPTHFDLTGLVTGTSKDLGISSNTMGEICRQFAQSRNRNKGSLRYRSSFGIRRSRGWIPFGGNGRQTEGNSVTYLGNRVRWFGNKRRPLPPTAKGGAFVEDTLGRWWVCFVVETEQPTASEGEVGIDLGLKDFAALSTGEMSSAPRYYRQNEKALATAQRSRKARRVKALHTKVSNRRRDYQHKLSTHLCRTHALIAIGDVNPKRLAKTRMAKSVYDAGWSTFRKMLAYKAKTYIEVGEKFTTQTCSECGSIAGPKGYAGLNKREWDCPDCGSHHDRDVNSAKVILARGLSIQARADGSRRAA